MVLATLGVRLGWRSLQRAVLWALHISRKLECSYWDGRISSDVVEVVHNFNFWSSVLDVDVDANANDI